ncbi:hypothetical protein RZS08_16900, partial [Arthrospira platensis SPKY1]|nr:hypothetical protein [Arthrospira platensis SPKY1]
SSLIQAYDAYLNGTKDLDALKEAYPRVIFRADSTSYLSEEPYTRLETLADDHASDIFSFKGRKTILHKIGWLPARPMTYDEAQFRVISDYQEIREREWVDRIHQRYAIRLDERAFSQPPRSK